jgi:outer membrane biosynthesis protein TonB
VTDSVSKLAWPLAASLALHLAAGWILSPTAAHFLARPEKTVTLTVSLAQQETAQLPQPAVAPAPAMPTTPETAAIAGPAATDEGRITSKARFLVAPDLSPLEQIAVPFPGTLTVRLHVSALGTVDRVSVVQSDPVPKEMLDGLLDRLGSARLTPAQAGSQPVASTLDLVIRFEVAPTPLPRGR